MLSLVFKNIKNSILGYRSIYIILIVSQLITSVMLFFVYGVFGSFNVELKEYEAKDVRVHAYFNEDVKLYQLKRCLPVVLEKVQNRMEFVAISGRDENVNVSIRDAYRDGNFRMADFVLELESLLEGRWITEEEATFGDKVVVLPYNGSVGDTVVIAGESFKVVGVTNNKASAEHSDKLQAYVPFISAPDELSISSCLIQFKQLPTQEEYDLFKNALEAELGNAVSFPEFEIKDEEEIVSIKTIIAMSVLIGIIAALDTALLYGYILKRRKKQMAVYGIVGIKHFQRVFINELEILLISIITTSIGFILFKYVLEDIVNRVYENAYSVYTTQAYIMMIAIYIFSVLLATTIISVHSSGKKILDIRREM